MEQVENELVKVTSVSVARTAVVQGLLEMVAMYFIDIS